MADETIACWTERFSMAIDDILAMSSTTGIVAEGPGFFPECLGPILSDSAQAIWLVPSTDFKIASAIRRNKPGNRGETSDPERAQRNLIERDLRMGEHIRRKAQQRGLMIVEVNQSKSLEHVSQTVEEHFGIWLQLAAQGH